MPPRICVESVPEDEREVWCVYSVPSDTRAVRLSGVLHCEVRFAGGVYEGKVEWVLGNFLKWR